MDEEEPPRNNCYICRQRDGSLEDVIEMDAASNNGVDEIVRLNDESLLPSLARYKGYIIDEGSYGPSGSL